MKNISQSKISYYWRNRRCFLNNPRFKSKGRVKTKPTLNQLIKQTHNQFVEKWGPFIEVNQPAIYESMTGKKARKPVIEDVYKPKEEAKEIKTSQDDLAAYQKQREAEREVQLEKEREKLKKKEVKFNFVKPQKDWSVYGGWVNAHEPVNKGRLGSTQEWRKEKPYPVYY